MLIDLDVATATFHVTVNGTHGAYPLDPPPPGHLRSTRLGVTWRSDTGPGARITYRNLVAVAL